jgi:quinol monooxygenase YgiN
VEAFKQASFENASNSVKEPGIARFDVIQQADDPTKFILVEIYKTAEAPAAHKGTAHYAAWRDTVSEMMAEPRQGIKYTNIFPTDESW